jgi:hypothetical protein
MTKRRLVVVLVACLLLASTIACAVLGSAVERRKVRAAYEQLRQACEEKRLDDAYLMMTQDYRKRVALDEFKKQGGAGTMFSPDATDCWIASNECSVWSESSGLIGGYIWTFKKEDGLWRCDGHSETWSYD